MSSLHGYIDLHLHSGPDLRPRRFDDVELARAARDAGMRAILIKSHHTITADRAQIAGKQVPGIAVFGGVALNRAVGGINPDAVEAALALGARQVWMPTISATVEAPHRRPACAPVRVVDDAGDVRPEVRDVLALVRDADAILGTGHLVGSELGAVVAEARRQGLRKVLVTHPEHPLIDLTLGEQRALAAQGVYFERCFCFSLGAAAAPPERWPTLAKMAAAIREVGPASTVLATDLGRADLPDPVEGYGRYLRGLEEQGLGSGELRLMGSGNPARLLGL
jgi:hypothetical protein